MVAVPDARVLSAQPLEDELQTELSLRPKRLKEYIGQQKVKANLEISIAAARKRNETLDHVLRSSASVWRCFMTWRQASRMSTSS